MIDYLIDIADRGIRLDVVLLNVQPKPLAWQARAAPAGTVRERLPTYRGKRVVRSVRRRLEPEGIATSERIEMGSPVEAIVRSASEEACDAIVMAAPRIGRARKWLARMTRLTIASVAADVMQSANVPVVIVSAHSRA